MGAVIKEGISTEKCRDSLVSTTTREILRGVLGGGDEVIRF